MVVTIDAEKLAKTISAKREERTALEAHRDGVNKNLAENANTDANKDNLEKFNTALGSDTNSVKTPDNENINSPDKDSMTPPKQSEVNFYTEIMPSTSPIPTMDIPTSAYESDMREERQRDTNDYTLMYGNDSMKSTTEINSSDKEEKTPDKSKTDKSMDMEL